MIKNDFPLYDIILSSGDTVSSARNVFEAEIISLSQGGSDVIVELEAGFSFKARISGASAKRLGLESGGKIIAPLKASSVSLY